MPLRHIFLLLLGCCFLSACADEANGEVAKATATSIAENRATMVAAMEEHLAAVSAKDLEALAATLSPDGQMQLMLEGNEIIASADSFLRFHEEWFAVPGWTFETKILNTEVSDQLGMAIVESMYREPERDGQPYFNRMTISYVLKKTDGKWYVIKDHATSVEKSTDAH